MPQSNPKIVFWGTAEFALPALSFLIEKGCFIAGVITNPDEPVGRKQILTPPPVKTLASRHHIPIWQPVILKQNNFFRKELAELEPDIFIVAAYGKIIPKEILDLPPFGALNIHPSLLPQWRGPSPIQFTILNGDRETGVTIIKMDELVDHGPVTANYKLPILNPKTTYQELHERLAQEGAKLLLETLPSWLEGKITPVQQDEMKATYSKILKRDDGRIDWSKTAQEIERQVRAFTPWPGSWTMWPDKKNFIRLKIEESDALEEEIIRGSEGYISTLQRGVAVKTKQGSLLLKKIMPGGGRAMGIEEFLRGHPDFLGSNLI